MHLMADCVRYNV